jgi:hypothetical protein
VFDFPDIALRDLEVVSADTVWLLPVSAPAVIRLDSNGNRSSFETGYAGLPSGLSTFPSGRWAISFQNPGVVLEYNSEDILLREVEFTDAGDVLLLGLNIWVVDVLRGSVTDLNGTVVAGNCADAGSRLCRGPSGCGIVNGSGGVFVIEPGEVPEKVAASGSACYSSDGILLLDGGTLLQYQGDTLLTELPYTRISASPDGETVVLWGREVPMVLE